MAVSEFSLSSEQVAAFERDGYTLVPNVLTPEEVSRLRAALAEKFDSSERRPGDTRQVLNMVAVNHPETRFLLTHPKVVGALGSLLGPDYAYLPEMSAHDSNYGNWHKDTTAQEASGIDFHWQDDYRMVEAAFYLQDNDEYGGGLDVVPGSHLRRDRLARPGFARKVLNRLGASAKPVEVHDAVHIPGKAGDLVVFHFRLDHNASRPTVCDVAEVPPEKRKLAIFFACSRNNEHVEAYKRFIFGRDDYGYLKGYEYPEELIAATREQGLTLA